MLMYIYIPVKGNTALLQNIRPITAKKQKCTLTIAHEVSNININKYITIKNKWVNLLFISLYNWNVNHWNIKNIYFNILFFNIFCFYSFSTLLHSLHKCKIRESEALSKFQSQLDLQRGIWIFLSCSFLSNMEQRDLFFKDLIKMIRSLNNTWRKQRSSNLYL